jgi:uncharacterized membrane protein
MTRGNYTVVRISVSAIFTAVVCVATMVFTIYVPATRGFFNIGETMIYTTALLFGPFIGAFAGGIGSMLADLLLGYPVYAPATLIIKALEGSIVGFLNSRNPNFRTKNSWWIFTSIIGLIVAIITGYIGMSYYTGQVEASLGFPFIGYTTIIFNIPQLFWILVASAIAVFISYIGLTSEPKLGWMVLSVLLGGFEMIVGYFLYQWFLFGPEALVEIPINMGQLIVGLLVSIPLVKIVQNRIPNLKL